MQRLPVFVFSLFAIIPSAWAQFELPGASPATVAEMVSEAKTITAGAKFSVALKLDHPDGWHSYYQNSGGVEQAPAIKWDPLESTCRHASLSIL